jgi:hypothetical protein
LKECGKEKEGRDKVVCDLVKCEISTSLLQTLVGGVVYQVNKGISKHRGESSLYFCLGLYHLGHYHIPENMPRENSIENIRLTEWFFTDGHRRMDGLK